MYGSHHPFQHIKKIKKDKKHLLYLGRMDTFMINDPVVAWALGKDYPKEINGIIFFSYRNDIISNYSHLPHTHLPIPCLIYVSGKGPRL